MASVVALPATLTPWPVYTRDLFLFLLLMVASQTIGNVLIDVVQVDSRRRSATQIRRDLLLALALLATFVITQRFVFRIPLKILP